MSDTPSEGWRPMGEARPTLDHTVHVHVDATEFVRGMHKLTEAAERLRRHMASLRGRHARLRFDLSVRHLTPKQRRRAHRNRLRMMLPAHQR